jgi:hypothetical protein
MATSPAPIPFSSAPPTFPFAGRLLCSQFLRRRLLHQPTPSIGRVLTRTAKMLAFLGMGDLPVVDLICTQCTRASSAPLPPSRPPQVFSARSQQPLPPPVCSAPPVRVRLRPLRWRHHQFPSCTHVCVSALAQVSFPPGSKLHEHELAARFF